MAGVGKTRVWGGVLIAGLVENCGELTLMSENGCCLKTLTPYLVMLSKPYVNFTILSTGIFINTIFFKINSSQLPMTGPKKITPCPPSPQEFVI